VTSQSTHATIDYDSGERIYLQIARIIRDRIISGELPVGAQIPSGAQMRGEWGVNRLTGAMAVEELRKAGLVVTKPGRGTFVAASPAKQAVTLRPGDKLVARMPTEEERLRLSTGHLTPVLVITRADGRVEPYNAAVTVVKSPALAGKRVRPAHPRGEGDAAVIRAQCGEDHTRTRASGDVARRFGLTSGNMSGHSWFGRYRHLVR
jgi:DNA-binding transcriptional regulator YhcF (GntR family)